MSDHDRPNSRFPRWFRWFLLTYAALLYTTLTCCATGPGILAPDPEARIGYNPDSATTTSTTTTTTISTTTGDIGGDGDSIALWLAIAALAVSPLMYPIQRKLRRRLYRWNNPDTDPDKPSR